MPVHCRTLVLPIISLILLILGSGLFTTFISIRLAMAGTSPEIIGVVASAFYAGVLAGSLRCPKWIASIGHLRTLIALCAMNSAIILLHALWIDPFYWALLRFFNGIGMGALLVVIESWFLLLSSSSFRSQSLSIYLLFCYLGVSMSQQLLNVSDPYSFVPYCLASTLFSLSILPIVISTIQIPTYENSRRFSIFEIFHSSPKGFAGGVVSGMLLASVYGLGPIYGKEIGLSLPEIATFMSIIVFGGMSLQWPLGKWADRSSRKAVLVVACFASAFFSGLFAVLDSLAWPWLLALLWFFGGFSFVLYPLSMAFACEKIPDEKIIAATSGFVLSYGIGSIAGPLIAPLFMAWIGTNGLFYFLSAICLLLGIAGSLPHFPSVGKPGP